MRLLLTLCLLAALPLVASPAEATHYGPCTHEYFDVAFYDVMDYKNGGLKRLPGDMVAVVTYCATQPWLP
ncbi:MAG TPA: hypothetical protein VNX21_02980 [Candidatus Thermoplasmatota archaeon]|nr:hypothetical protein [Candidatus Thermoplasmatota archaeon]